MFSVLLHCLFAFGFRSTTTTVSGGGGDQVCLPLNAVAISQDAQYFGVVGIERANKGSTGGL